MLIGFRITDKVMLSRFYCSDCFCSASSCSLIAQLQFVVGVNAALQWFYARYLKAASGVLT